MKRHYTIMIVPDREKGSLSFKMPRFVVQLSAIILAFALIVLTILSFDYFKVLQQVYRNKHLSIENQQLREQVQIFQMKINTLSDDLNRVYTFERKLRAITGIDEIDLTRNLKDNKDNEGLEDSDKDLEKNINLKKKKSGFLNENLNLDLKNINKIKEQEDFKGLKGLYEQKIATNFGLQSGYQYTKEWFKLTEESFKLADSFALFDYKFNLLKETLSAMEHRVHQLDTKLLERESFLKSTPTLLPTKGWITSYYGPRKSHYSGRIKMHEGLDVGADPGTPIIAPADGVVTFSGAKAGFGFFVQLDHGYGIETIYAHAKRLLVKKGENIKRGNKIALVGNTGLSTGPHLHYEVRINGTPVDPLYYILD